MQDIHTIGGAATIAAGGGGGGGGVSLFVSGSGGGGGGGDRRLRQITNQVLKCPRCDSSNTKFCYYNNYNLSQPRHFCKNCRRYWTKGGVLRNVPVGGGCRKAKRSKSKQSEDAVPVANNTEVESNSNSSSESSSLTGTTTTTTPAAKSSQEDASATATATATVTVTVNSSNSSDNLLNFPQPSRFFLDQHQLSIFPETGSFMSLMTPLPGESSSPMPSPSLLGFNFADVSAYRMQQNSSLAEDHNSSNHMILTRGDEEYKMDQINYGYLDPTANIGFTSLQQSRVAIGGLAGLDWQINGVDGGGSGTNPDQGLFDFAGTDDQAYLSQTHWLDNDAPLNFPPLV